MRASPLARRRRLLAVLLAGAAVLAPAIWWAAGRSAPRSGTGWVGTWAMAPSGRDDLACRDCTIRNVVHASVGGDRVRVHLSNLFRAGPLTVTDATVALPAAPGSAGVAPGTLRVLTFGGRRQVVIPAGGSVVSDPARLRLPADHDLLVTTFVPGDATAMTIHPDAQQYSYLTSGADAARATAASALPRRTPSWYVVTGVDVAGSGARGAVVAFGDSITDGYRSSLDLDHRWPDFLAARLRHLPPGRRLSVLDAGIGGNRVLRDGGDRHGPAALSRFDRDVLAQTGVRAVIILEGVNDILQRPHELAAGKIVAGLRTLADRAHRAGLRVIGGTLTPFEGWYSWDRQQEATRQAVNRWIRHSGVFDAVADFDAAVRNPADPHRLLPRYDSGDHLHPNDRGYAAMGAAVDLGTL